MILCPPDITDSSHFILLALAWTGLIWSLFCWTRTLDQCLHKELEFPTWLSSHNCCLSTCLLVLHTGKTEFYVAVLGILHGAHWTLSLSQSFFFFLLKDRETNSMLLPSSKYWFFSSISLPLFPLQCLQIIFFFHVLFWAYTCYLQEDSSAGAYPSIQKCNLA